MSDTENTTPDESEATESEVNEAVDEVAETADEGVAVLDDVAETVEEPSDGEAVEAESESETE